MREAGPCCPGAIGDLAERSQHEGMRAAIAGARVQQAGKSFSRQGRVMK